MKASVDLSPLNRTTSPIHIRYCGTAQKRTRMLALKLMGYGALCHIYYIRHCFIGIRYIGVPIHGGAGGARAPPEFGVSQKGRSLISADHSLAISTNTPGFEKLNTALIIDTSIIVISLL